MKNSAGILIFLAVMAGCNEKQGNQNDGQVRYRPELSGNWWQVAGNPDLGELTSPNQQPVDFGIWQAADGTWQIWSCIRSTQEAGHSRLFHCWEGDSITQEFWKPKGIAMRADTMYGEGPGGLQAPFVIRNENRYQMFYGDWNRICLAESSDGKTFTRALVSNSPALFGDPAETNTRDPMLIHVSGQWHCYYVAHPGDDGAIYLRKSGDLRNWSESVIVSHGGSPGTGRLWMAECPHVVPFEGNYYLFRTYSYGRYENGVETEEPKTNIYCSSDPENFGVGTDSLLVARFAVAAPEIVHFRNEWYIAALMPDLQGIRISRFKWISMD
jgi:hypothetical protein